METRRPVHPVTPLVSWSRRQQEVNCAIEEALGGKGRAVKLKHPAGGALPSAASVCSLPQPQTGSLNPVESGMKVEHWK